jgi:hypothetical protein
MSPRQRFRQNKDLVTGYNDIVDSNRMVAAFDAAMLQFVESLNLAEDHSQAASHAFQLAGAQKFLNILKTLNLEGSPVKKSDSLTLNHDL